MPIDDLSPAYPGRAAWGTAARLRAWQVEALARYRELGQRDFLAVATPGAGKTTFALRVALARATPPRITVKREPDSLAPASASRPPSPSPRST